MARAGFPAVPGRIAISHATAGVTVSKEALLDKIAGSDKLPMLPDVAMRIVELNNDPDLYPGKVAAVIASDPALSARLLQVSNSSMFPFRREITNLNEALAVLGVELTMSIAVGFAVIDMMRAEERADSEFDYDSFWRKSVLGAVAAIEMRSELSAVAQGDLFMASLLQDIGMLALDTIAGSKYSTLTRSARSHLDLVELERRVFGIDHAEVGTAMLRRWKLPDMLVDAVASSHVLLEQQPGDELSNLEYAVNLSGMMAEQWIAESTNLDQLDAMIQGSLNRFDDEAFGRVVCKAVDAIPAASDVFSVKLLSDEQLLNVA